MGVFLLDFPVLGEFLNRGMATIKTDEILRWLYPQGHGHATFTAMEVKLT
jgi:hypothetical protein